MKPLEKRLEADQEQNLNQSLDRLPLFYGQVDHGAHCPEAWGKDQRFIAIS
jgi:hypothetical protein